MPFLWAIVRCEIIENDIKFWIIKKSFRRKRLRELQEKLIFNEKNKKVNYFLEKSKFTRKLDWWKNNCIK